MRLFIAVSVLLASAWMAMAATGAVGGGPIAARGDYTRWAQNSKNCMCFTGNGPICVTRESCPSRSGGLPCGQDC
jgi:hypothetical protein